MIGSEAFRRSAFHPEGASRITWGISGHFPFVREAYNPYRRIHCDPEEAFESIDPGFDWREILRVFRQMPVSTSYSLRWGSHDTREIRRLLVEEHEFSEERVEKRLEELSASLS